MKISIFGSTGTIGKSAVSLLLNELSDKFETETLSFHLNAELAVEQASALKAKTLLATSHEGYLAAKTLLKENITFQLKYGDDSLMEESRKEIDVALIATVGVQALKIVLESIGNSKVIAIANKEAIICGWHLIKEKLNRTETKIIPVDSEHNSLYRLFKAFNICSAKNIFITASGGPFIGQNFHDLTKIKPLGALKHPTWRMGNKISIDSATMVNKGLELIEACKIFDIEESFINVFIARGSLLHAGINLKDGSSIWFLSNPDMKNHIAYAITNENIASLSIPNLAPATQLKNLEFEELQAAHFPLFFIARDIARNKSVLESISFNILNEIAVEKFLSGEIKYTDILKIISENLNFNPYNFTFESVEEIEEYYSLLYSYTSTRYAKAL